MSDIDVKPETIAKPLLDREARAQADAATKASVPISSR